MLSSPLIQISRWFPHIIKCAQQSAFPSYLTFLSISMYTEVKLNLQLDTTIIKAWMLHYKHLCTCVNYIWAVLITYYLHLFSWKQFKQVLTFFSFWLQWNIIITKTVWFRKKIRMLKTPDSWSAHAGAVFLITGQPLCHLSTQHPWKIIIPQVVASQSQLSWTPLKQ